MTRFALNLKPAIKQKTVFRGAFVLGVQLFFCCFEDMALIFRKNSKIVYIFLPAFQIEITIYLFFCFCAFFVDCLYSNLFGYDRL